MKRIPDELLARMAAQLSDDDRDEMAIPSYRHANPVLRWMAWRRLELIARRLSATCRNGSSSERVIVDFGCGTGVLLAEAAAHAARVYGVDLVLDAARTLVREWNLETVTLLTPEQAQRAISAGSVDVILAAEVLEHIDPLDETLALFRSWLKPTGTLLVSLPTENAAYRLGRKLAGFRGHYHHAGAVEIHRVIEQSFLLERLEKLPPFGPLAIYWITDYRPG